MSVPYRVFLVIITKNSIKCQGTRCHFMEDEREKRDCPSIPHKHSKQEITSAHKLCGVQSWRLADPLGIIRRRGIQLLICLWSHFICPNSSQNHWGGGETGWYQGFCSCWKSRNEEKRGSHDVRSGTPSAWM